MATRTPTTSPTAEPTQKLRQTQNMDEAQTPESRIISQAPVPLSPSGPKRSMIVGASIPLGVLLGILTALIVEKIGPLLPVRVNGSPRASLVPPMMRTRPRRTPPTTAPVAVWNGPPILSEINDPAQLRAADFVLDYPASKYSHAMAALVRQLESRPASGVAGAAIVAVTSPDNGENRAAINSFATDGLGQLSDILDRVDKLVRCIGAYDAELLGFDLYDRTQQDNDLAQPLRAELGIVEPQDCNPSA